MTTFYKVMQIKLLVLFFVRQTFLHEDGHPVDISSIPTNTDTVSAFTTTPVDVVGVLQSLPKRKAPGQDGITTDLLCLCSSGIATSLSVLFNRSFADQHFPTAWKEALVVPVYKKGNRSQLTKYRPIALLSAVGKVCERLIQV